MKWFIALLTKIIGVVIAIVILYDCLPRILNGHIDYPNRILLLAAAVFACPNRWSLKSKLNTAIFLSAYALTFVGVIVMFMRVAARSNWMLLFLATPGISFLSAWMDRRSLSCHQTGNHRSDSHSGAEFMEPAATPSEIDDARRSNDQADREWAEMEILRINDNKGTTLKKHQTRKDLPVNGVRTGMVTQHPKSSRRKLNIKAFIASLFVGVLGFAILSVFLGLFLIERLFATGLFFLPLLFGIGGLSISGILWVCNYAYKTIDKQKISER